MTQSVVHAVARDMLLMPDDITGSVRTPYMVKARKVCTVILRDRYAFSFPRIARILGRRDHTTIIHLYKTGKAAIAADENLTALVERHMVEPKLPPLVFEPFSSPLSVKLDPRIRNPRTAAARRAAIAEAEWQARCAA